MCHWHSCQLARIPLDSQLMEMRIRLPELLEERGLTAYAVAQQSGGRIEQSGLYRLMRKRGKVRYIDADLMEALCDVLGVEPGDLLEREGKRRRLRGAL